MSKTTLLSHVMSQARTAEFKDYCMVAFVDERQTTPASSMEKFAPQLHLSNKFEKALHHYKETLRFLSPSQSSSSLQDEMITKLPDYAGKLVEGVIPIAGPLLGEGVKVTTEHLLDLHQPTKEYTTASILHDPLEAITGARQIFATRLGRHARPR